MLCFGAESAHDVEGEAAIRDCPGSFLSLGCDLPAMARVVFRFTHLLIYSSPRFSF